MASSPIIPWQIDSETMETVRDFIFLGSKITADGDCSHEIQRRLLLGRKAMTNLDNVLKSRKHHFSVKGPYSHGHIVQQSCSDVRAGHREGREPNWCFWTVVLEKTLESPSDCKEIKPANPKVNQPWIFIGRTNTEAEAPILWPPDAQSSLLGKDPDAEKDWRQEKKATEDEMVGCHHRFNGHEFE